MRILCVDDEEQVLNQTSEMCRELAKVTETVCFTQPQEALDWLSCNKADIALLDIGMPDMDGLTLAEQIQERYPGTAIIFLTGSAQYAVDAFAMHVSGYILKPASKERLAAEIEYADIVRKQLPEAHICIHTFGEFDVVVDGEVVSFTRARARELLAYLVDRQGRSVTRATAFAILWEDEFYDRPMQKQMDVVVRSLRDTLKKYGISEIFELQKGSMRVVPEYFDCDLYRFFDGDIDAVNAYHGEYMNAYSWASMTESYMDRISGNL